MAWTTNQVAQNGNTTATWEITGGALSTHDAVVVRLDSGSSGLRLEHNTVRRSPLRYNPQVRVVGGGAVSFRMAAEEMD